MYLLLEINILKEFWVQFYPVRRNKPNSWFLTIKNHAPLGAVPQKFQELSTYGRLQYDFYRIWGKKNAARTPNKSINLTPTKGSQCPQSTWWPLKVEEMSSALTAAESNADQTIDKVTPQDVQLQLWISSIMV